MSLGQGHVYLREWIYYLLEVVRELSISAPSWWQRDFAPRPRSAPKKEGKKGKKGFSLRDGSVFQTIRSVSPAWFRRKVARSMRDEIGFLPEHMHKKMLKRISSLENCGRFLSIRSCGSCGEGRDGSGTHTASTCKLRTCPSCSWTRARRTSAFFEEAVDEIPEVDGYEWQFLVLSTRYNPRSEDSLTISALRGRALLCQKWAKACWKKSLNQPGAAMFRAIECSNRGMVHVNLVYYGPPVDAASLPSMVTDKRTGLVKKKVVKAPEVHHVARYAAKGMDHERSGFDERWMSGKKFGTTPAPELSARWEMAVFGMQLTQRYGALRGLAFDEHEPMPVRDDSMTCCAHCGVEGDWKDRIVRTESWMRMCHDRGMTAMVGSKWHVGMRNKPPP